MGQAIFMTYLRAFLIGGAICAIGQLLIDKTKLTPARILVIFVSSGVVLTALGLYQKLVDTGGAGATVPLTGFGYSLAKGVFKDVEQYGLLGAFTGGIKATAAGITAAIFFGYLVSVVFVPKAKR
jgi:stage V sporulation protein AE